MTPAGRALIETALSWSRGEISGDDLITAARALEAERQSSAQVVCEMTWGEVVEGDEVWSPKVAKWFTVMSTARAIGAGEVLVQMRGIGKRVSQATAAQVRVRRGPSGEAVDILNQVLWSGPSAPETESQP